jgi:ferredoxin-NADP reductase
MRFRNSWMEAEVLDMEEVAPNIRQIQIQALNGSIPFTVGAHIDVSVLVNDLPEIRSYSLVGMYERNQPYTIAVKRMKNSKGGSDYMWSLKKGNKIKISAPLNHFELSYISNHYLLIAAGIGITPLVGMAEELKRKKNVEVSMIYIGTEINEMPYIKRLQSSLGENLIVHFSNENGRFDVNDILTNVTNSTLVYMCGPLGFMNEVKKTWQSSDFVNANLRFETFGASGLFPPQKFKVKIPRFDKEVIVSENQSLLKVLDEANIDVMYDCMKGECGLCQVDILEYSGAIDHRDFFFNETEKSKNNKLCACVSRVVNGDLVIDTAFRA